MRDASTHALSLPAHSRRRQLAERRSAVSRRTFVGCDEAAVSLNATALAGIVLFIIAGFIGAQLAMSALADILPDYLADLGTIFTAIAAVNTSTWPPIVATLFGFLPVVLGVVAIAALFGAGALIAVGFKGAKAAGP